MDDRVLQHTVLTAMVEKFPPQEMMGMAMAPRKATSKIKGEVAKWDVKRRGRDMATLNTPGSPSKKRANMVHETKTSSFAYMRESKMVTAETMWWLREAGKDFVQAGEKRVMEEMEDLNGFIDRRMEWMIWQMFTGEMKYDVDDVTDAVDVDYGIPSANKPTAGTDWDDFANATILANLRAWKRLITRGANMKPTDLYMTEVVHNFMISNDEIIALLQNTKGDNIVSDGVIKRIQGMNVNVYDSGWVDESTGTYYPYISDKHIIMLAKGNPTPGGKATNGLWDILEGPALDVKARGRPGKFSKSWEEEDPSGTQALIDWYALPVLYYPEAVVYARVDT